MRRNINFTILIIVAFIITGCVRPASGTTVKIPTQSGQSNPVSTQSALMKEIIAGTQTAMALASGGTPAAGVTNVPGATVAAGTQAPLFKTATPLYASPTPRTASSTIYPTLTPGPPPVVEPTYVGGTYYGNKFPEGGGRVEVIKVVQDWSVTIQTDNFPPNLMFTVLMDKYGTYAEQGIQAGYTNSGSGGVFTATYNIPNALRGLDKIHIRLVSPPFWAVSFFDNINWVKP
jgi:hypothetical protein